MKKSLGLFLAFIVFSLQGFCGRVDTLQVYSTAMHKDVPCVVIVPDLYGKVHADYPVVYLLHGYSGNYLDWITQVPALKKYVDEFHLIIVCPDGGYSSWYFDSPIDTAMRYKTFMTKELVPDIDAHYHTLPDRKHRGIIDTIGGKKVAERRLDTLFTKLNATYYQNWFAAGNEPDFEVPWCYNWAGAPYKTRAVVRRIIEQQYSNRDNGLPGNDDLGAMGAWYVFANIGLYPETPGVGGFSINGPSFPHIKIHLSNGTVDVTGGSENKYYIKSLQLNGRVYNNTWLPWERIQDGARLNFKLTKQPNKNWGISDPPPSFE